MRVIKLLKYDLNMIDVKNDVLKEIDYGAYNDLLKYAE